MAFLRRLHCHFCGARSQHGKSSGVREFQCTSCEAVNFLDSRGNIMDTPASAIAQSQRSTREKSPPFQTFTERLPETLDHQQNQAFCNTCVRNQHFYMEALANYLPDEDDPDYQKYEDALPQYKKELEQRWPQVCRKCAPKAQRKINRADYYAGTQNINKMSRDTATRQSASLRRRRDDWGKWTMRVILRVVGMIFYASLMAQAAWHVYGILAVTSGSDVDRDDEGGLAFDPPPRDCIQAALHMRFSQTCSQLLSQWVPHSLLISLCLIWYNPGLKDWFHHTHRIEAVTGQTEHARMQLVLLIARAVAWYKLSVPTSTTHLTTQQLLASHGAVVLSLIVGQWVCTRTVKSVKFKLKQKMMPRPEERDVLGAFAGPEHETYDRQASSIPPSQLFARDHITPFPIANLAPRRSTRKQQTVMPSPPPSDETDEEGDPMELDDHPPAKSQMPGAKVDRTYRPVSQPKSHQLNTRSMHNYGNTQGLGFSGMRDELFGIEDNLQLDAERMRREAEEKAKLKYQPPVEQSPFRGRLPPAPMSMERRLRNPVTQVSFRKTPITKQQNFLQQMRNGIEQGQGTWQQQEAKKQYAQQTGLSLDEFEEEFSPAKSRTRGQLELREGTWKLRDDGATATGLEDLFGGSSFKIADEPAITLAAPQQNYSHRALMLGLGFAVPIALLAVGWSMIDIRRTALLWFVAKLEDLGY